MSEKRVALIQFPGSNCEWETKRAAESVGLVCDVFRWNRDPAALADYDGYLIGGGFSYQDRVRSGVVATKQPIMRTVFREVTEGGKPVMGICNGCQVLVEAGLIPGLHPGQVEMGMAPNFHDPAHRIAGFCCRWVYLKLASNPARCQFTGAMTAGEVFPIPIAHGEGRFTTRDPELLDQLIANDQIVFQYVDADGRLDESREVCPNGALANIAGLCNPEGNVLGLMPHPERHALGVQHPQWTRLRLSGPGIGRRLFQNAVEYFAAR